jgi:hypothetical protein
MLQIDLFAQRLPEQFPTLRTRLLGTHRIHPENLQEICLKLSQILQFQTPRIG